jgi:hypothetical protein
MTAIQTRPNPAKSLRRRFACCTACPIQPPPGWLHQPGFFVGFFSSFLGSGLTFVSYRLWLPGDGGVKVAPEAPSSR